MQLSLKRKMVFSVVIAIALTAAILVAAGPLKRLSKRAGLLLKARVETL